MTEFDPENYHDDDELDLEEPLDGRDGQPPEEGSSDDPTTLDEHDPLRAPDPVLVEADTKSTTTGAGVEPTPDEAVDEERVLDDTAEADEEIDEPQ